ncbi:Partial mannosyltransferase B [Klebsiella pneumoniae]|uniref:glycosyltransferase family 4 protein n=1 Tax=Klebsiella/Raoultella group TaxID=2890311 RepID=UPI000E2D1EEA|nr:MULTISPECIES: glycosyltransferase family 1 protein [Klebsiella/Raoultella group]ELT0600855.1 glycosyltransferase family 4 protein [Raoultella ornithinolytica]ELT0732791.1 glycosyltransferase family 4 protein [Raoultella ornithinolytica]MCF6681971.1 glycosyltransferase family 4 protein [Raoultella ornithinolytica]RLL20090.1 glycosyltransferase [Klebsiella pneumoniae]SXB19810.1 Partial mannosyltransferase B [Klebsiella pneumoniae]
MNKKIYIDGRWGNSGGIGTFSREINKIKKYETIKISGNPASPIDTLKSSIALFKLKNAVVFFPGYIPPLFSKVPFIITMHDLNHIDRTENSSYLKRFFYNTIIKKGCQRAAYIFTVSDFSKERIIKWSGVSEEKVINVSNGVSEIFTPEGETVGFDYKYILCVSNRKKHKNEIGTLIAFSKARINNEIKLVFTGSSDDFTRKKIIELHLQDRVIFTGHISNEELAKLYRSAEALIFVSFYEGFGLPVIEAQSSGVPVITSCSSSLGEISGGSALLVEPNNIEQISDGITKILTDVELSNSLVQRGFDNIKRYSWEETARLVDYYLNKL